MRGPIDEVEVYYREQAEMFRDEQRIEREQDYIRRGE
jgi:hypothetical protein